MPFINPTPLVRWGYGRSLPPTRKDEALTNKTIFLDWFGSEIVKGGNKETCSESIFLYPQSSGGTNYRNRYIGSVHLCHPLETSKLNLTLVSPPSTPLGFSTSRIAVHAETPDMVVPGEGTLLVFLER